MLLQIRLSSQIALFIVLSVRNKLSARNKLFARNKLSAGLRGPMVIESHMAHNPAFACM